jgi:hypothetical protein
MTNPNEEVPGTRQLPFEIALEDALAVATPAQVLRIMSKIKEWLVGYCETCGVYTDLHKRNSSCNCPNKGIKDFGIKNEKES